MPKLTIDNQPVEVPAGATVLEAARLLGIDIPTLCHRDGCRPETSCLVCVVRVNGGQRLLPSCATPAVDSMVVESETAEIQQARRTALELLLSDHLGDCLAPCQTICPAHLDIPNMIRLISAGRMAEAIALVKRRIPIPAVLGRICPEICERGCRRAQVDAPVSIKLLKRLVGDWDLAQERPWQPVLPPGTGKRVAIVGAGPAGLSAAYYLRGEGHAVTTFDERQQPGGGLRYGVPPEALEAEVLEAELQTVLLPGIELRQGMTLGRDFSLASLVERFDAVLLACGEITPEQAEELGLPYAHHGLEVERDSLQTPVDGVFACGSAVSPSKHAARAVGAGRTAAVSMGGYLRDGKPTHHGRAFNVHLGKLEVPELPAYAAGASLAARSEAMYCLSGEQAAQEAQRCLSCDCAGLGKCRLRQWAARYGADPRAYHSGRRVFERDSSNPFVIYQSGKCLTCGLCVQITKSVQEPLGLSFVGRGFSVRIGVPWSESLAAGLQKVAEKCAAACPSGAIVLKREARP
ncbi:MAG: 2Fe-2S iron-sulfur cluster-binding protein [Armatimonadota bacterium]